MMELRRSPPFKNNRWEGRPLPKKDPKNFYNSIKQVPDASQYFNLDAGPSILKEEKFCDITGFRARYQDKTTYLRYFNTTGYKIIRSLNAPSIQALLDLRKAA